MYFVCSLVPKAMLLYEDVLRNDCLVCSAIQSQKVVPQLQEGMERSFESQRQKIYFGDVRAG